MIDKKAKRILVLLVLVYVFFILGNGILSLTNPDEVFYSQTAKEMIQQKSWMTPYLFGAPQFEKPVLLYWFLRIAFMFFGVSSFSARLFPAFFAAAGVVAAYLLSLIGFKNEEKAFISSLILMSSGLYIGLARTVFTDMIFSVFILLSLMSFYWDYSRKDKAGPGILLFFIFSGLAVLTKGPLGILIPLLVILVFLFVKKDIKVLSSKYTLLGILIFIALSLPWYIFMIRKYGSSFTHEFFYNDHFRRLIEAEHRGNDKWYFYPFSMIGCMFPWSVYTLTALIFIFKYLRKNANPFYIFLISWVSVVFLVFQFAHSKLVSYIFPLFPALAIITGNFIYEATSSKNRNRLFFNISLLMSVILWLLPIALIVASIKYSIYIPSKIPIYIVVSLLVFLSTLFSFFITRGKFSQIVPVLIFLVPAILFAALFMHKDIEPYVSSETASEFLSKNYPGGSAIICSKFFARGVRFYTDKEIAIINISGNNFFSPHPIPFLDTDTKVSNFLNRQPITYCLLRKSQVKDMERISGREFKLTLLKIIGDEYLLKVEANTKIN